MSFRDRRTQAGLHLEAMVLHWMAGTLNISIAAVSTWVRPFFPDIQ
ncbi:hypothetical protein [Borborobacter arsenicus]|nr:hypothetical protein [Pseudaminobacter arsenicus]